MRDKVHQAIFELLPEYAGRVPFTEESLMGADLHIDGSDSVELLDKLEDMFSVDLRPLVERGPMERTGPLYRFFGIPPRRSGVDITVKELIDFITENGGQSKSS